MTIRNALIRAEIRLLWKHFPNQVRDILNDEGKHIQGHKISRKQNTMTMSTGPTVPIPTVTSAGSGGANWWPYV